MIEDPRTLEELLAIEPLPRSLTIFNIGTKVQANIQEVGSDGWSCTTEATLHDALRQAFLLRRSAWPTDRFPGHARSNTEIEQQLNRSPSRRALLEGL